MFRVVYSLLAFKSKLLTQFSSLPGSATYSAHLILDLITLTTYGPPSSNLRLPWFPSVAPDNFLSHSFQFTVHIYHLTSHNAILRLTKHHATNTYEECKYSSMHS